jgi:hypothetical protein
MGAVVRNGHRRGLGLLTCEVVGGSALVVGGNASVEGGNMRLGRNGRGGSVTGHLLARDA